MSRSHRRHIPAPLQPEPLEPRTLLSSGSATINYPTTPLPPLSDLLATNGQLLFINDDGSRGRELWRSDGTLAGSSLLRDINPGSADAFPPSVPGFFTLYTEPTLFPVGATTYFTANDGVHGRELWKTDGTPAGTTLVKDLTPGGASSSVTNLTNVNGRLYFTTSTDTFALTSGDTRQYLWKTDGTPAGTTQLANLTVDRIQKIFPAGDMALVVRSTSDTEHAYQLWKTSPSAPALAPVTLPDDLTRDPVVNPPQSAAGKLLFLDRKTAKLWRLDPATAAFTLVTQFTEDDPLAEIILAPAATAGGNFYFTKAVDPHRRHQPHTFELWVTDGTPAGTRALYTAGYDQFGNLSSPTNFRAVGNTLYFSGPGGNANYALWRSDGTPAGTRQVAPIGSNPADNFVAVGPSLFFADGTALWKSDGTPQGTATVAGLPGPITDFTAVGSQVVLRRADNRTKNEFWAFNTQSPRRRFRQITIPLTPDVRLRGGILGVRGLPEGDTITVTADPAANTITVDWNGIPVVYPLAGVSGVVVNGYYGSDVLTLVGPVPHATLFGGEGNDTLTGGDLDDQLHGDSPSDVDSYMSDYASFNDVLRGGAGNDDLFGEAGDDTLDGGDGADVLSGGTALWGDTADYSARTRPVEVTLDGRNRDGQKYERDNVLPDTEIVLGGASDDYLDASARPPVPESDGYFTSRVASFRGNAGNDTLIGSDGNDYLVGGAGNDYLRGRDGADTLFGDEGDDTLYGDTGIDSLVGGLGTDRSPRNSGDTLSDIESLLRS